MLKLGAWIISPLLFLPLCAQEAQVLPQSEAAALPSDRIMPVPPPPQIQFGATGVSDIAMPKSLNINNYGGGVIEGIQGVGLRYKGPGVKITSESGLEAYADSAVVDVNAQTVTLEGNVSTYEGNILQRGDRAVYFYERKFLDASKLRVSLDPILLEAGKFTVEDRGGKKVYVGENAGITTDDAEEPDYWLRAKKTTIYPNEKIVFNNLRFYAGDVPVFWLPYLSQPLSAELGYHLLPGTRSNWGPFLLNTYGIMLGGKYNPSTGENEDAWLLSRWHFDLRSIRGVGTGVDFVDTRLKECDGITGLSLYYLNDIAPETTRTGVTRGPVGEDRYRVELKHRLNLGRSGDGEWRVDSNLALLSDQYYLEDFNITQYRTDPAPDNTLGVYRRDDESLLSVYARFRINDFYRADTRLPEVSYDQARGPLFDLPILHEGSTSLGIIGEQAADPTRNAILDPLMQLTAADPAAQPLLNQLKGYERQLAERILALPINDPQREAIRVQLLDSSYARFNTYQEFSMPLSLGDVLTITPQAGIGHSRYAAVDGPVGNSDRTYLHAGAETSMKFSKDLGEFLDPEWGINGLKHVMQPYLAWSTISTNDFDPTGLQVDRLSPTTRPQPLDPTRFTAVDDLTNWNIVRLGTRNHLLTKRDNQSLDWLYLDTYIDAFINDPEHLRDYSNLYNEVRWQPLPWLAVDVSTQFPIAAGGSGFNDSSTNVHFMPTRDFDFSVGYQTLNGHPVLIDSNRVNFRSYTRVNENWGFSSQHTFEFDDGTLELQQYTLHRDLGSWVAGLGLTSRDNRLAKEYGIIFSLTLKSFSEVSLPFQIIGEQ
jgi:LPS-assembly protein